MRLYIRNHLYLKESQFHGRNKRTVCSNIEHVLHIPTLAYQSAFQSNCQFQGPNYWFLVQGFRQGTLQLKRKLSRLNCNRFNFKIPWDGHRNSGLSHNSQPWIDAHFSFHEQDGAREVCPSITLWKLKTDWVAFYLMSISSVFSKKLFLPSNVNLIFLNVQNKF